MKLLGNKGKKSDWNLSVWKSLQGHLHGAPANHCQTHYLQTLDTEQWQTFPGVVDQLRLLQDLDDS